jgi:hypothetical protein
MRRKTITVIVYADPRCRHCRGSGKLYDIVDYGSAGVPLASACECWSEVKEREAVQAARLSLEADGYDPSTYDYITTVRPAADRVDGGYDDA